MSRTSDHTLQADSGVQGNFSSGYDIPTNVDDKSIGVGLYTADGGTVVITPIKGANLTYNSVPAGTSLPVPLFTAIHSSTTSTDITIALAKTPRF